MIPYKWPVATLLPRSPEARHEILKAAHALAGESEPGRSRHEEIASIRSELEAIRQDVASLGRDALAPILVELRKYGYNPAEPRIPKHQTGGGEWTEDGAQVAASATDDAAGILRRRGGHHIVPKAVYGRLPLKPETEKAFDAARTGRLRGGRHGWDKEHDAYNQAVHEALEEFLETKWYRAGRYDIGAGSAICV